MGEAEALGGLLEGVIAELGLSHKLAECRAKLMFEEAVGPTLARQARALGVENGRMEVAVASAVWRNQLSFMKQEIAARINELVGEEIVKELILMNRP